jgi:hypothetical protein
MGESHSGGLASLRPKWAPGLWWQVNRSGADADHEWAGRLS